MISVLIRLINDGGNILTDIHGFFCIDLHEVAQYKMVKLEDLIHIVRPHNSILQPTSHNIYIS